MDSDVSGLVSVRIDGPVWILQLDRAERHNALVPELLRSLRTEVSAARAGGARALVLTGAGPSFSTGGDVASFARHEGAELAAYAREIVGELNEAMLDLMRADIPVIAAVHGPVTGGSLGLVLASDLVVAGPRAWFQPYYAEVGFSPDGGWGTILGRRVGAGRSLRWQLLNERVEADTACAAGLVTHRAEDALAAAVDLAHRTARMKPGVVSRTKALVHGDLGQVAADLEAELDSFVAQIVTSEAATGMRLFLATPRGER